ncbi:four helix bundle protein [Ignavibacteria bacterium 4148-Me]|uniref:four helix bundle protein n=1 Tax=Rosettibacter primus TaxID=3111523 RepID=UPI00336C04DB
MIRKNINRGYTKLRVWQDSMELFKLIYNITKNLPYEINKIRNNTLDAANSIVRNISEGYCRKNLREYLNFLNISLGSCGELNAAMISLKEINVINEKDFEKFDVLHYKVENELISLIKSLQEKQMKKEWEDSFVEL